jgi:hypothetical protein
MDVQSRESNSRGTIGQGKTQDGSAPKDNTTLARVKELKNDQNDEGVPVHLEVCISQPDRGVVFLEITGQRGNLDIQGMQHYHSAEEAELAISTKASSNYLYDVASHDLENNLRENLREFLEICGIDNSLMSFIREFILFHDNRTRSNSLRRKLYLKLTIAQNANMLKEIAGFFSPIK